jgi:hypothetical protein
MVTIEYKHSGSKDWRRITGGKEQLSLLARIFHLEVKPPKDNQPAHIDWKLKQKGW